MVNVVVKPSLKFAATCNTHRDFSLQCSMSGTYEIYDCNTMQYISERSTHTSVYVTGHMLGYCNGCVFFLRPWGILGGLNPIYCILYRKSNRKQVHVQGCLVLKPGVGVL